MSKLIVNIIDSTFSQFAPSSVAQKLPEHVEYVRWQMEWDGITIFTDQHMLTPIVDQVKSRYKIGWLVDARELRPHHYEGSKEVKDKFDLIVTYDKHLLAYDPQTYRFAPHGGVWTAKSEWDVYHKTKNISMILSDKTELSGHKLRHAIADTIPGIDIYGPRGVEIGIDKSKALKDYRYSIVVEACQEDNFFSEHLLDCIAHGTIPLYCGCPNIDEFFSMEGILYFDSLKHLRELLPIANEETYSELLPAAWENLELLSDYEITDDWIAKNILYPYLGRSVC